MKDYLKIMACCLILLPFNTYAVKIPGLYEVEVPVADRTEESRKLGVQAAMRMALIKLTGDRHAPGSVSLAALLESAESYMSQYRYKKEEPDGANEADQNEQEGLHLWVRFDEHSLEQALRQLSVPVWGKERPSTLVWLVVEKGARRELIGLESGPEYVSVSDKRAHQRGIALIFPLLDMEDNARIRASDIWAGFTGAVQEASSRYRADSILTGRISSTVPGIWEGQWRTYVGDEVISWQSEGDLPEVVLDEGIDGLADILARRFAQAGVFAELTSTVITVLDIANADHYAKVLKYLQSLNSVDEVQVNRVDPGSVTFTLTAHGGEAAVAQAIKLGHVLGPVNGAGGASYRLLR